MRTTVVGLAILPGLGGGEAAHAGRPFATEDAGVLEAVACEFEAFGARARALDAATEGSYAAQFGCGVGANTQLALAVSRLRAGGERATGVALAGKTALWPPAEQGVGVTLAYAIGAAKAGNGDWEHDASALVLVASEQRGRIVYHGNLGLVRDEIAGSSATAWAFAVERLGARFDVGFEVFSENSRSPWVGVGARYAVTPEKFYLDASFAQRTNSTRAQLVTVGLKVAF
jgi:hypothetical protein